MSVNHTAIQSIASAAAVLISITAAVFAWQQVEVGRVHNRLSVTPILQITPYLEGKSGRNGLFLSNDGLGPAIVKSFEVRSNGITASGFGADRWDEIIATTAANPLCFGRGWPKGETTLKAGSEVPLVYVTKAEGAEGCMAELVKLVGGSAIEIEIGYESIYGEPKHLSANSKAVSRTLSNMYQMLTGLR